MRPKVSTIIPTYNSEKYIAKAIKSVLQQTESQVEIIVVDDASVDATVQVVQQYKCDRLQLLVNDCNRGPSYSRNRAIAAAQGEWIALLDSDDWFAPERIEKLLQVALAEDADVVADDLYLISDRAEQPWGTRFSAPLGFGWRRAKFKGVAQIDALDFIEIDLGIVKPIFKRSFLIHHNLRFDDDLRYGEDFQFYLKTLICGAKFIVDPQPYYFYCSRPGSLITDYLKCQQQMHADVARFLLVDAVKKNFVLARSLTRRYKIVGFHLKISLAYNQLKGLFKSEKLFTAIAKIITNPQILVLSILHVIRNLIQRAAPLHVALSYKPKKVSFNRI